MGEYFSVGVWQIERHNLSSPYKADYIGSGPSSCIFIEITVLHKLDMLIQCKGAIDVGIITQALRLIALLYDKFSP